MAENNGNGQRAYNPLDALNRAKQRDVERRAHQQGQPRQTEVAYRSVLEYVQTKISTTESFNKVLSDALDKKDGSAPDKLKNIIMEIISKYPQPLSRDVIDNYSERIFNDMYGYGILTEFIEDPRVEEINGYGPGPYQIEVIAAGRPPFMLKEGFSSNQEILDMVRRMIRKGGMTIDLQTPRVDSYMEGGIRISAMISPVIRDDKGAVFSIRKQSKSNIRKDDLVKGKTALQEEIEFIELCTRNKVSGAIVGATGSGKTTLLNMIMTDYVQNAQEQTRVFIIEESRELQLPEDARVFYTAVCGDEKEKNHVSAPDLLKSALRFHPTFISCAEMRGEEAMNAMNAAQTGHIVWSTFHADNCEQAYQRLLTMCKMSGTDLSEELLMRNLVQAFPIIVSSQQLKDGSRKITGVYEATGTKGSRVTGHYIYKLFIESFEYEGAKIKAIHGKNRRVGDLSDEMAQRIFDNCGLLDVVKKFAREGWEPDVMKRNAQQSKDEPVDSRYRAEESF